MAILFFILDTEQECIDALMQLGVSPQQPTLDPEDSAIPLMDLPRLPPPQQAAAAAAGDKKCPKQLITVLTRIIKSVLKTHHKIVNDYVSLFAGMTPATRLREWKLIRGYVTANSAALLQTHIRMMTLS